ncbi:MAG TPA: diguanylate cyclase [Pirellulaceae bacterium]|nr:diguanylate cyclase [Pirellulaceae bacterium]
MNPRAFAILIVSPDRGTLRRLSKFLEVFGYDVRQATDGPEAIAAAESSQPDFLILDGSSGKPADLQLCGQVRGVWPDRYSYCLLLVERPSVADITSALELGCDDFLAAPIVFGELLARLRTGARVLEFERRLSEQAGFDPTTGLADKAGLAAALAKRASMAKGSAGWLTLIDPDYFQRFTDRYGRRPAQDLLRQVADKVQARCGLEAFAASLGDDRLAILLPASGSETAVAWAEQVLASLAEETFTLGDQSLKLTASCGLTELGVGETLDVVLARAQRSLQLAKSSGRNCVVTSNEVDRDAEQWNEIAADGKLFTTTQARDVMSPCPVLIHLDETFDQAHAMLQLAGLPSAPVVDGDGRLAGVVSLDQLAAARLRNPKARTTAANSSVRLVRQVMSTEVTKFEEATPLSTLMEFFTGDGTPLAVVVRDKRPRGLIHCQGLASLNDRLTADHFVATKPRTGASEDLLVPDLAIAE